MKKFIDTEHCGQGFVPSRCRDCRIDQVFRDEKKIYFEVPDNWDAVCPHGITLKQLNKMPIVMIKPRSRGLGDTLAKFIHWISFGWIKPCCGCRKRQAILNKLIPYRKKTGQ